MADRTVQRLLLAHDCDTLTDILKSLSADSDLALNQSNISEPLIRTVFLKLFSLDKGHIPISFGSLLALSPLASLSFFTKTLKTSFSDIAAQTAEIKAFHSLKTFRLDIRKNDPKAELFALCGASDERRNGADEEKSFFSAFLATFKEFLTKTPFVPTEDDGATTHFVAHVCAASDLVLNARRPASAEAEFFLPQRYFRFLAQRIAAVMAQGQNLDPGARLSAKMVTKLVLTGRSHFLWDEMAAAGERPGAGHLKAGFGRCLRGLSRGELERCLLKVAVFVLGRGEGDGAAAEKGRTARELDFFFSGALCGEEGENGEDGDNGERSLTAKRLLTERIWRLGLVNLRNLPAILDFLHNFSHARLKKGALAELALSAICKIWASPLFALTSPTEQAQALSVALCELLPALNAEQGPGEMTAPEDAGLTHAILDGVQSFLECPCAPRRHCGLAVAEAFSRALRPLSPVEFDELRGSEISRGLALVRERCGRVSVGPGLQRKGGGEKDPGRPQPKDERPNKFEEHFAREDYGGEGPAPAPARPPPGPVHAHEALALLRQSDSAAAIETALEALPRLLRSPAARLGLNAETAAEFAALLATLTDSFGAEGFAERRAEALALLAARFPRAVVPELAGRLLAERYSVAEKTGWLLLLRGIAEALAAAPSAGAPLRPGGASELLPAGRLLLPGGERFGDRDNPLRPRVSLAQRRGREASLSAAATAKKDRAGPVSAPTTENRFSEVAHLFFNPALLCLRALAARGACPSAAPAFLSTALAASLLESLWRFAELCGCARTRLLMARDIVAAAHSLLPRGAPRHRALQLPPLLKKQVLRVLAAVAAHPHCGEALRQAPELSRARLAAFADEAIFYGADSADRAAAVFVRHNSAPELGVDAGCKHFLH